MLPQHPDVQHKWRRNSRNEQKNKDNIMRKKERENNDRSDINYTGRKLNFTTENTKAIPSMLIFNIDCGRAAAPSPTKPGGPGEASAAPGNLLVPAEPATGIPGLAESQAAAAGHHQPGSGQLLPSRGLTRPGCVCPCPPRTGLAQASPSSPQPVCR